MSQSREQAKSWSAVWVLTHPDRPNQVAADRQVALLALGIVRALQQQQMTVADAWESGLNFRTYMGLKARHAKAQILRLLEWGMELPQVEKLGAEALADSYLRIEQLATGILSPAAGRLHPNINKTHSARIMRSMRTRRITHGEIKSAVKHGRR